MTKAIRETFSNKVLITISVMLAAVMQTLDTTIANVALPHMQSSLSATQDQITWVLTSYIVAAAIMTLPTGILSNKLGRKRYFIYCIIGFTVASMLCGVSVSLTEMVTFRMLQGVFGASLVPLSQAILLDTFPKEEHGSAMAMWGFGIMIGPILGPTLGGYLTEYYSWRWVFFINLPFGILALLGVTAFVMETNPDKNQKFNILGFLLMSIAVGSFQMMLDRGEAKDWFSSGEILIEAILAVLAFYFFAVHLMTAKQPFLNPRLFLDRNFITGLILISLISIILYSTLALLPPFLQNLKGYPVLDVGYILAPRGMGTMIAMLIVGRLINKVDTRLIIMFGLSLTVVSLYEMMLFSLDVDEWSIIRTGIVQGFGFGFIFIPLSTVTFSTIDAQYRTEAASMYSLIRNIGSSIGISISANLLSEKTQMFHAILAESITPFNPLLRSPLFPGAWDINRTAGLSSLNVEITRQAQAVAYINDFAFMMWICVAAIPMLLILRRPYLHKASTEINTILEE